VVDLTASAVAWTFIAGSNETGTGGGGGLANAYVALTDGANSAVAVGGDTIKFRAGNLLTGVVTNDDVTHGDNVLFSHGSYPAFSVLANATNVGAVPSALTSSAPGDVLWRSGSALLFGPLNLGTVGLSGVLPIANGGTAANTTQGAINSIGQLTALGDILYHNGTNHTRLPRGSNGQVLSSDNSLGLLWVGAAAHSHTHSDVSDWDEAVQDTIGTSFISTTSIAFSYNDAAGQLSAQRAALTGDVTAALNSNATLAVAASGAFNFAGIISDLGLVASQNNYAPTGLAGATTVRFSSTGSIDITGLTGGVAGRLMVLQNVGTNAIVLRNENASSTALNRFALNADITLSTNQTVALLYDGTTARWRATGAPSPAGALTDGDKTDITVSVSGTIWTIDNDVVNFAKMQNIATDSLIGRDSTGSGDPENILLNATLSMDGAFNLQRAALTGDVSANAGSNTTVINNGVVSLAKMANMNTDRLLGRDTAAVGVVEELAVDTTLVFTGAPGIGRAAITGDVSVPAASNAATIANDAVTYAKMQNVGTNQRVLGKSTGAPGDPVELDASTVFDWIGSTRGSVLYRGAGGWAILTPGTSGFALTSQGAGADPIWTASSAVVADGDKGDISITGGVWSIDAGVVSFAKMQNIPTDSLMGRDSAGPGVPESILLNATLSMDGAGNLQRAALTGDITAPAGSNATTLATVNSTVGSFGTATQVGQFTVNGKGLTTAAANVAIAIPSTAITDFVEASQDVIGALLITSGDLTWTYNDAANTLSAVVANNAITYAKMQDISATQRVIGKNSAGAGDPEEVTASQVIDWIGSTRGSVLYRGAAGWAALTPGTSGFALTSQGAGADPIWSAASAVVADGDKGDISITGGVWSIDAGVVSYAKMQNVSATQRILGRNTAGAGIVEEVTETQALDWIGATRGQILYRGASAWLPLSPGTAGQLLQTGGAGADPSWITNPNVGKQTIYVPASAMQSKASAGAQSTTRTINSITVPVMAFDTTTQEGVQFSVAFPKSWNAGTITFQFFWVAVASSGTAQLDLKGGCFADNISINITGLGTAVGVSDTWQNTDRVHVSAESAAITLSNAAADTVAFFDLVRNVATDTMGVDLELIGIKFFYTTNAGNDA
jgi:hypothetical protein